MLLLPADDENGALFGSERDTDACAAAPAPEITEAAKLAARSLRDQFGANAEKEVDRRMALAMQDLRLEEAKHLWTVWLALRAAR